MRAFTRPGRLALAAFVLGAGIAGIGAGSPASLAQSAAGEPAAPPEAEAVRERLAGHGGPVRGLAVSADGAAMLTASFDYSVIHWRFPPAGGAARPRRMIGHEAPVNDVAFVPGGEAAVSVGDDGALAVWSLERAELRTLHPLSREKLVAVAVAPDGALAAIASWDGTVRLWDLTAGRAGRVLAGHGGPVNDVAFSPDGARLFTASYDGTVRRWNLADGEAGTTLVNHGWAVNAIALAPGGDRLVFGAADGAARVVSLADGEVLAELEGHREPVLAVAAGGRGLIALASADGTARVYDAETFERIAETENPFGPIWTLGFAAGGRGLYYGGLDDHVMGWQFDPQRAFEPVPSRFPRRFQVENVADEGERQFARKCSVCHTLTPDGGNRAGPSLYGVFGRRAGAVPDYPYSEALASSSIIWNEETIGALFDLGPDRYTPGSKMPLQRMRNRREREALVAYLKRASDPANHDPAARDGEGAFLPPPRGGRGPGGSEDETGDETGEEADE